MIKHVLCILFLLAVGNSHCFAQFSSIADKTAEQIKTSYKVVKDVSYGSDNEQKMDIYISQDVNESGKRNLTMVFVHGGGYYGSDKSKEEKYIEPYLRKGLNVVNINYRLKKGIPTATEDLTKALNFLHEINFTYELTLGRVVLSGFSAGAQMASIVGLSKNNSQYPYPLVRGVRISGIINFSGPVDGLDIVEKVFIDDKEPIMKEIGDAFFPSSAGYTPKEVLSIYEPITYYDKNDPPFFLWYGGKDNQIPPITFQKFVPLLNKVKGKNVVMFLPEGLHSPTSSELQEAYREIFVFLDRL